MTRAEQMRQYKAEGHTNKEVAIRFNVTPDWAKKVCKGVAPQGYLPGCKKSDEDVACFINERLQSTLEYYGNYTGADGSVDLICKDCGTIFTRSMISVRHYKSACPKCKEKDLRLQLQSREKRAEGFKVAKEIIKSIAKAEREAEEIRKRKAREHPCPVCGEATIRKKYCSPECAKKADNKRRDFSRRMKLMSAMVDKDITVEGLYRRDNGTCYLCGRKCNFEDYTVRDGSFIAGDWYPSIDHVIPLVKGGLHSWDNVMLAHHRCNWEKSDKTISPYR